MAKQKTIPTIIKYDEARRLADACRAGQMRAVREVWEGRMQTIIKSPSGSVQAAVGAKAEMFFDQIFTEQGSGDGLFPGFSQTLRTD
jgi:hypothetical protein